MNKKIFNIGIILLCISTLIDMFFFVSFIEAGNGTKYQMFLSAAIAITSFSGFLCLKFLCDKKGFFSSLEEIEILKEKLAEELSEAQVLKNDLVEKIFEIDNGIINITRKGE